MARTILRFVSEYFLGTETDKSFRYEAQFQERFCRNPETLDRIQSEIRGFRMKNRVGKAISNLIDIVSVLASLYDNPVYILGIIPGEITRGVVINYTEKIKDIIITKRRKQLRDMKREKQSETGEIDMSGYDGFLHSKEEDD